VAGRWGARQGQTGGATGPWIRFQADEASGAEGRRCIREARVS